MRIQEASIESGMPAKTIRFYESIGILPPAARAANGYRTFDQQDVRTLKFIQRARDLGFPIDDIQKLLSLWQDKSRASADVKALAMEHVREIDRKIKQLESVRHAVMHLARRCHGDNRPDCPILSELAEE